MDLGIAGRTALVTASSQGMGRNIAFALAAEGVDVALFARTGPKLAATAAEIAGAHGVRTLPVAGDMRDGADVTRLAASIRDAFGGLDILVVNTGRAPNPIRAAVDERDDARWHEAYQTQLWGAIQVTQAVLPLMLDRGWGRIVAITSSSVKEPMAHHSLSTVFRAGVTAYMKHLANEIGHAGITVNCVAPALIDTSHRGPPPAGRSEAETAARRKMTPLGRLGTQEEVTGVVTFLASRQAGFITGSSIQVEGGMVGALV
jgi:3-oxoacyl-[acyl-carrier protein] reductase